MQITDIRGALPRNGTQDSPHTVGQIQKIIVHHDAQWRSADYNSVARYQDQARYHINSGEDGLQYHYKIDNVGEVFQCRDLTDTLWHCGNYPVNRTSIAICVDGNFNDQMPTREQFAALKNLLDELCTKHPEFPADEGQVFGHNEMAATACPGNNLKGFVVGYRNTGTNTAIPNVPFNDGSMGNTQPVPQPPVVVVEPPKVEEVPINPTEYTGTPVPAEEVVVTVTPIEEPVEEPKEEVLMTQDRIKSPVMWAAILAQVVLVIGAFLPQVSEIVKLVGGSVLEILVLLGILNNPTDSQKF